MKDNTLTDAQRERLIILAEECSEVIKEVGKILRHGPNSYHPDDELKISNKVKLEKEIADINVAVELLVEADFVNLSEIDSYAKIKKTIIKQWLHYEV